jgi:antagonist of KipI
MAIKFIKPGMFTTIQDMGRMGYRHVGIGPGGAMDFFAASVANYLVGNDEKFPVIEMHFPAAEILVEQDALISITGANFTAYIDDAPAEMWRPLFIKKNARLSFKKNINGARVYLAIKGGMDADRWLNSFSTHTKVKAGGFRGRILAKEDTIALHAATPFITLENFPYCTNLINTVYQPMNTIRCIAGPEWDLVNDESQKIFYHSAFSITMQSDRMGYRLQGVSLGLRQPVELISSPVDCGTIQLLPNGQLIVLMADHQTTGGYPRIANVVSADLPKLAQVCINNELQFEITTIETAEEALFSLYQTLDSIKNNCNNYYDAGRHQL